ncbi:phosphoribosylaminoimidazolesuccinocarboxamide synthase [Methylobacterium sp. Gmos1]
MQAAELARFSDYVLPEATLPDLPGHYRGKVRDNYDLPDGRRILITSDRLSAFDRELAAIPLKGQVLTQTARYWFEKTRDICDNHVLAYPDPNVVVGRRLAILPVEIVVRGYLAGSTGTSILTLYKAGQREMYGHRLPDGMRPHEPLPQPIITPTTKAGHGDHDAPLSAAEILERGLLSEAQWRTLSEAALALFARGQTLAAERGLILADTKYEFGTDAEGRIVLADEIHTPDSSRYWFAKSYPERLSAGTLPDSFDKDVVRNWVAARCDPYRDPVPAIPPEVVLQTAATYVSAFETITGERFALPDTSEPPLERIRRNIAAFLAQ